MDTMGTGPDIDTPTAEDDPLEISRRARRLVSLSVGFRALSPDGVEAEGFTTGLNERGLAGRVTLIRGDASALKPGALMRIQLNLQASTGAIPDFHATLLRLEDSWVPGFRHFLVLRIADLPAESVEGLRRFIDWREDHYFTEQKPARDWYVHSRRFNETCGPLTRNELNACRAGGLFEPADQYWAAELGDWRTLRDLPVEVDAEPSPAHPSPMNPQASSGNPGAVTGEHSRAPRFLATPVAVRISLPAGMLLEGYSTGLNEMGLGCRVNGNPAVLATLALGLAVSIEFILPRRSLRPMNGHILRIEDCWVPGMQRFLALKFDTIDPQDFDYLRRFIGWREREYITVDKPERAWFIHSPAAGRTYGPLTTIEVLQSAANGSVGAAEHLWSPQAQSWIPFTIETFKAMAPDAEDCDRMRKAIEPLPGQARDARDEALAGATHSAQATIDASAVVRALAEASERGEKASPWRTATLTLQVLIIATFVVIMLYHALGDHIDPRIRAMVSRVDTRITAFLTGTRE